MPDHELPAPLVPPEVDLRDFPFMPLDVVRLLTSDLAVNGSAKMLGHQLMLWAHAWHQVPAGSLPNVGHFLAKCSTIRHHFARYKDELMSKWVLCSDGRYYHPVVCEKAMTAWASKQKQRQRTAAATAARLARNDGRNEQRNVHQGIGIEISPPTPREKVNGKGRRNGHEPLSPAEQDRAQAAALLRKYQPGKPWTWPAQWGNPPDDPLPSQRIPADLLQAWQAAHSKPAPAPNAD